MSGVFGMFSPRDDLVADTLRLGLFGLQHRGENSCGIAVSDGQTIDVVKGAGLVPNVITDDEMSRLPGRVGIGHVRSTDTGSGRSSDVSPLHSLSRHGHLAIAQDGSFTNADDVRKSLLSKGALVQTENHGEIIAHLMADQKASSHVDAIRHIASRLKGAYAVLLMTPTSLIAFRDPLGIRPMVIGRKDNSWFIASESCAFDTIGVQLVRDVRPGEMCIIDEKGLQSIQFASTSGTAYCMFEFIYFARADSVMEGRSVHHVRKQFGRKLAEEANIPADLVVPAPDSALSAAVGYSEGSGIPFDVGLVKNRYVGRTFIRETRKQRDEGVRLKLNPITPTIKGKRIVLVDDSIVRGTTSERTISTLKRAGASEIHMVVASPPFSHPCQYGIHVPKAEDLIAANRTNDQICQLIGADSLTYLSFEAMYAALELQRSHLCTACFGEGHSISVGENGIV